MKYKSYGRVKQESQSNELMADEEIQPQPRQPDTSKLGMMSRIYFYIVLGVAAASVIFIFWQWSITSSLLKEYQILSTTDYAQKVQSKILLTKKHYRPATVKGLYLTAYSAGNPAKIDEIINLLDKTELNSVVIDIKDYSGYILYDSKIPAVNELNTKDVRVKDVPALIKKLHEHNIYVIARQTVFQDPVLAEKKHDWAIKSKNGGLWKDNKGLLWVDPTRKEVWDYNIAIAQEAIRLGFDEMNFDYVRFPSDGNISLVVYNTADKKKYEIMHEFYHYLNTELSKTKSWISIDMFGFVMEKKGEDDMGIGQRLVDSVGEVDAVCPMMYPSHYPAGHLGLNNPADFPALVIANGMKIGSPTFSDKRAKVRPWIQAFNMGAIYDAEKIRAQINEVEKYPGDGWLLWNASNRYTSAGLKDRT